MISDSRVKESKGDGRTPLGSSPTRPSSCVEDPLAGISPRKWQPNQGRRRWRWHVLRRRDGQSWRWRVVLQSDNCSGAELGERVEAWRGSSTRHRQQRRRHWSQRESGCCFWWRTRSRPAWRRTLAAGDWPRDDGNAGGCPPALSVEPGAVGQAETKNENARVACSKRHARS